MKQVGLGFNIMDFKKAISILSVVCVLGFSNAEETAATDSPKKESEAWWKYLLKHEPKQSKPVEKLDVDTKKTPKKELNRPLSDAWTNPEQGYTVNFNNVSIIELIHFISQITKINFIYNEEELNFNVTMVSEGPASIASILSNFIQILRIHNLLIAEDENNLIIHTNENVNSPATIITDETEEIPFQDTSLVTRVFTLNNTSPNEIIDLIKPMVSTNALLQASQGTKHLIVTDTAQIVSQLQKLIKILDTPQEATEIAIYTVQNFFASSLTEIANKIIAKLGETDNILLIPQQNKETIIIVSSPILVQKTLSILKKIDTTSTPIQKTNKQLHHDNIFLYTPENRSAQSILSALDTIAENIEASEHDSSQITHIIATAKYLPEIGSILFLGDPTEIGGLKQILSEIDQKKEDSQPGSLSIFLFDPQYLSIEQLQVALENIATSLKESKPPNQALIDIIESMHPIASTSSVMFIGEKIALDTLKSILKGVDVDQEDIPAVKKPQPDFLIYNLQFTTFADLEKSIDELIDTIQRSTHPDLELLSTLKSIQYIENTNSITATGSTRTLTYIKEQLASWDSKEQLDRLHDQFLMYKPTNRKPNEIIASLTQISSYLKQAQLVDKELIETLESIKLINESQSILFTGATKTFDEVQSILSTIDTPLEQFASLTSMGSGSFLIYNIQKASQKSLVSSLKQIANKLEQTPTPDIDLIDSLENPIYLDKSHSIMFTGDKATLKEVSNIVSKLDIVQEGNAPTEFNFYVPQYVEPKVIVTDLKNTAEDLEASGLNDPALIQTLLSASYSTKTQSILLTGTKESIAKVDTLLKTIDVPEGSAGAQLFIYKPKYMSPQRLIYALKISTKQLTTTNSKIYTTIDDAQIIGNSISFKGPETSIHRIQELIKTIDTENQQANPEQVFIYRPEFISSGNLMKALKQIGKTYENDPSSDLAQMIATCYIEKNSNAFVFHGSKESIEKLKVLLKDLDVAQTKQDSVFVYTLQHVNIEEAEKYLQTVEENIKHSSHPDEALLNVIQTAKPIPQSNSLMFSGKASAIDTLKGLLEKFDSANNAATPKQTKSSFLMYTPQHQNGQIIEEHILNTAKELKRSGLANPYLIKTLEEVHYNPKSDTLLFTGNSESLAKVKELLEQFDVPGKSPDTPQKSNYLIYKPKYVSAPQLEDWLKETINNLKGSGLQNKSLFTALSSMKYNPTQHTLTFSGSPDALKQIQNLIQTYDIPANAQGAKPQESTDNITFFVYKLQFHQGSEIIEALQAIGADLKKYEQNDDHNKSLIEAITSIQWLKITNSLLATGTPAILERMKSLIKTLDIPLEQVFLEVLLLRTTVNDSLNFGLRWGGAGKILDKVTTSIGLFPQGGSPSTGLSGFGSAIQGSSSSSLPPATTFGTGGFDLGVIGDLIMHKGKTFLSLGSLASALQTDGNSTVIFNLKIIAQDNQPAHLFTGQNRPFSLENFAQTTASGGTTQTVTNEYRDVGFDLKITPIIGGSDVITLIIDQEFTESSATSVQATTSNIVNKQTTTTRVHVPNNHFVALSGALKDTRTRSKVGIPCLGGLPVIGAVFSDNSRNNDKDNIIIFIRPQITTTDQQMIDMTEQQEDQFRQAAGALEIQYDIDDAIDLITPIDELE